MRFELTPSADLKVLDVTACADRWPDVLRPMMREARPFVLDARAEDRALEIEDGVIVLDEPARKSACISYRVDATGDVEDLIRRVEKSLILAPDLWLWLPRERPAEVTVRFVLPKGMEVATPWPRRGEHFVLTPSTFEWSTAMALGYFERAALEAGGASFELAILSSRFKATKPGISRWITAAAEAVKKLHGRAAFDRMLVLIEPARGDGVVFGEAIRGGGPTVRFLLGTDAEDRSLPGEWIAVHEMSHHAIPFLVRDAAWLSEGLATYYQNVLRARSGLLSEREAWELTLAGFGRGKNEAAKLDLTLSEASQRMQSLRCYMRVYWSGSAIALLADVALRKKGGSLDRALARFSAKDSLKRLTSDEATRGIDRETLGKIADQWLKSRRFPEVEATLERLGVRAGPNGVVLDDRAPDAAVRRAIMMGK